MQSWNRFSLAISMAMAFGGCGQAAADSEELTAASTAEGSDHSLASLPPLAPDSGQRCGIVEMTRRLEQEHPELARSMQRSRLQLEQETAAFTEKPAAVRALAAPMVIPVVVHIIHENGPENVSDAKVVGAIEQVNEDFKALNADPAFIHSNFRRLVTDTQMIFRLAKRDPNGNLTNGITRTYNPTWSANGAADQSNMKLQVGWPQNKYLNVYLVKSAYGGNSSAFAYYPISAQPPYEHYDGIIISAWAFGRTTPGYYTILTHEIGHWANLIHTWGEGEVGLSTNCSTDDLVADTPNCAGAWGTACNVNTTTCSSLDNNENFMDYGQCQTMFTTGQVARMHAAMNSSIGRRNEIWQQANLIATGVYESNYAPTGKINGEYYGSTGVAVSFSSKGSYDVDGSIASYAWTFGDGSTSSLANPTRAYAAASTYTVTLRVTDNGGASSSYTTNAYITAPGTYITSETEPNDGFTTASGPVGSTAFPVTSAFAPYESDYYYFNVARPGKISITLRAASTSATVTWQLFHESNLSSYVAFPSTGGWESVGDYDATRTGRYYLLAYVTTASQVGYTLDVKYPGGVSTTCAYTISPASASYAAGGGSGSVSVTTTSGCTWTAASSASWLTVTSGASGSGSGTVQYSVAANTGSASRTGTLTIAGRAFTVTQAAGGGSTCTTYTGTLSGTGAYEYQPDGNWYQSRVSGTHAGTLSGPANTDFDLELYKSTSRGWTRVASSSGSTSSERISYNGTAGYYYWKIVSYSGSGGYSFCLSKP